VSEIETGFGLAADYNRSRRAASTRYQALNRAAQSRVRRSGAQWQITIEEVCRRNALSVEEFLSWHNTIQMYGVQGLEITKLQNYR